MRSDRASATHKRHRPTESHGQLRSSCAGVLFTPVRAREPKSGRPTSAALARRPPSRETWMRLLHYGLLTPEMMAGLMAPKRNDGRCAAILSW